MTNPIAPPGPTPALSGRLDADAALDRLLAALPEPPPPSPALRATILAAAPCRRGQAARPRDRGWRPWRDLRGLAGDLADLGWTWRPAGAVMAGALAVGLLSGSLLPAVIDDATPDLLVVGLLTTPAAED